MSAFSVEEVCRPSSGMSCDGFWSGTNGRHHQPYLAMIPESRYLDWDQLSGIAPELYVQEYDPKEYQRKADKRREGLLPEEPYRAKKRKAPVSLEDWGITVGGHSVPSHMSGWPMAEIIAWVNADGDKYLEEIIIGLHEGTLQP